MREMERRERKKTSILWQVAGKSKASPCGIIHKKIHKNRHSKYRKPLCKGSVFLSSRIITTLGCCCISKCMYIPHSGGYV